VLADEAPKLQGCCMLHPELIERWPPERSGYSLHCRSSEKQQMEWSAALPRTKSSKNESNWSLCVLKSSHGGQ
jgi:hypothetical protein